MDGKWVSAFRVLVQALNDGEGANFTTRHMLVGLVEGRSTTNFALSLMIKDLNAALSLGAETTSPMPMTTGARGLMQMGLNLFGKNAVLDDVIPLIEKLSDVKFKSDDGTAQAPAVGMDEAELLSLIDRAVMACNAMAVLECVAMGHRFGLPISQMARILNVGSAWSKASEIILPALASQSVPQLACKVEEVSTALDHIEPPRIADRRAAHIAKRVAQHLSLNPAQARRDGNGFRGRLSV